jgi:hypothetical protein
MITLHEADDPTKQRVNRIVQASNDVLQTRRGLDTAIVGSVDSYLQQLKGDLQARVMGGGGGVTDFDRFNATQLIADVDRLIGDTQAKLTTLASRSVTSAGDLGGSHADEAVKGGQLLVRPSLPGLDVSLVTASYQNAADLLSDPMRQFRNQVVTGIRRVAVGGEQRFQAITQLRDVIDGAGLDDAQLRAERIIRTEVGRSFNQATFDRLTALAQDFPFLRKGWGGVKDARTRQGHLDAQGDYARGKGIPVADLFDIAVYSGKGVLLGRSQMRFPIDPHATGGKLAAAATIFCRCDSFVDVNVGDFSAFAKQQIHAVLQPGGLPTPPAPTDAAATVGQSLQKSTTYRDGRFYFLNQADAQAAIDQLGTSGLSVTKTLGGYSVSHPTGGWFGPEGFQAEVQAPAHPALPTPAGRPAPAVRPASITPRPDAVAALQDALAPVEDSIRTARHEFAHAFDVDGTPVGSWTSGKADQVRFPPDSNFFNRVLTHNHPGGTAFSRGDGELAVFHNMAEIRAVTKAGTFRLVRVGLDWPTDLLERYDHFSGTTISDFRRQIANGQLTIDQANAIHQTEVWTRVAKSLEGPGFPADPAAAFTGGQPPIRFLFEPTPTKEAVAPTPQPTVVFKGATTLMIDDRELNKKIYGPTTGRA